MGLRFDDQRAPTIRALAYTATVASTIVALLVTVALVSTSARLEHATESIIDNAQSRALASEVELMLLMYQRISNLYAATADPEADEARVEMQRELQRLLRDAEAFISSEDESAMLAEIAGDIERFMDERAEVEAAALPIEVVLQSTQDSLNDIVQKLELLIDLNEAQVLEAQSDAMRWNQLAGVFGAVAAFVLISGLLTMVFGLHRFVLQPIVDLHETIEKFRMGALATRARAEGLREVRQVAQGFNEMADALAKQRENQLAFLAGVAHDLRSPLHALRLGIQAIALEQSKARRDRAHEALDRQVDRVSRMVDDLLDATRIEAGRLDMRVEEFDLRDAVQDMIRLFATTSPDHQIRAELPDMPVVFAGDPLRIEQVVSNLLSNAIKYSPQGGRIDVKLDCDGDDIRLSIADEGVGIRPEDRHDIFMPFRRRKTDLAAGAGLGLSVVRRIVEAHGGRIDVQSQIEQGSTFNVMLRRKPPGEAAPPADRALRS